MPAGYAGGFVVTGITVADDETDYDYTAVNTRIPPPSTTRPVTAINSGSVG